MSKILVIDGESDFPVLSVVVDVAEEAKDKNKVQHATSYEKAVGMLKKNNYRYIVISKAKTINRSSVEEVIDVLKTVPSNRHSSVILVEEHPSKREKLSSLLKGRELVALSSINSNSARVFVERMFVK